MADLTCAKCAEPWDAYGVRNGDMEPEEAKRFLKGEGCPCCDFGGQCSSCVGTGNEDQGYLLPPNCDVCRDKGYVLAWSPRSNTGRFKGGQLYTGYDPNVRKISEDVHGSPVKMGVRNFPVKFDVHQSRDGYVEDWWVQCPEGCASKERADCAECDGKGTLALTGDEAADLAQKAAEEECRWSDEDPMEILERRGMI